MLELDVDDNVMDVLVQVMVEDWEMVEDVLVVMVVDSV